MSVASDNPQPNALPAALRYAAHGFRVVPIAPAGKNPILRDWPNRASQDPADLRSWWQRRPDAGVGLLMGAQPDGATVIAVDVDNHNPAQLGADTIRDLEDAYGPLPATWTQITGTGGQHLLFRVPHPVRNDAGRLLGPGVDIRGDGGQIVAAPTVHPNGRPYEWDDGAAPWDIPIADAPGWLLALLDATPDQPKERPPAPYDGPERPGDRWAAVTPWRSLLEADGATYLATVRDGHELWARPGLAGHDLHTSASLYYKGSDVLYVFTTGWPGLNADTSYTKLGYLAATRFAGDHADAARWLASEGYGTPHDDGGGILGDTLTNPAGQTDEEARTRLRAALIHGDDITRLPAVEWLIPGVIQTNSLAALYGPPKAFKSFLAVDLALHLGNKDIWRGLLITRQIRTLYVVAEGAPGVGPRATAWVKHHGGQMGCMSWIVVAPSLFRNNVEAHEIAAIAVEFGCELVIIDTLARSIPGAEENSAKDLGVVVEHLDLIRTESGAAVMVVHHMGKNGGQGMRGSSALRGAIDTGLEIHGDAAGVNMMLADSKNSESGIGWWWKPLRVAGSVVLDPQDRPPETGDIEALNCLRQLYDLGGQATDTDWRMRCNVIGVSRPKYERHRHDLADVGLVHLEQATKGASKAMRWTLTEAGRAAINDID